MVTTYIYPPNAQIGKSQTLQSGNAELFLPNINEPVYYTYVSGGVNLSQVVTGLPVESNTIDSSITSAVYDSNTSILWITSNNSNILASQSGVSDKLYVTSGMAFLNGSTLIGDQSYFSSFNKEIYTVTSGMAVSGYAVIVSGAVGLGYSASGTTLFTSLPALNAMMLYTVPGSVSGTSTAPVTNISQIKAFSVNTVSGVAAVAGTCQGPLRGLSSMNVALAPDADFCAFINPSNNTINLLQGPDPNWRLINTYAASGTANWCAWNDISTQVLTTNTGSATISIYNVANSALSLGQLLSVPNTGNTRITEIPGSGQVVYCNAINNYIEFLSFTSSWVTSQQLSINSPQAIVPLSSTEIAIAASGIVIFATYVNATWGASSAAALPFAPIDLAVDTNGNVYAVGTLGGTGYLALANGTTNSYITWSGSGDSVLWEQGQIFVSDKFNSVVRSFSAIVTTEGNGIPSLTSQQLAYGPVHQYALNETTGNAVIDIVSGANGTYGGIFALDQPPIANAGTISVALGNSSGAGYIGLPFTALPHNGSTGAFSFQFIFKPTFAGPNDCFIIYNSHEDVTGTGFRVYASNGSIADGDFPTGIGFQAVFTGGAVGVLSPTNIFQIGGTYLITITYDGSIIKIYQGSKVVASGNITGTITAGSENIYIGSLAPLGFGTYYFAANYQDFAFYASALTAVQVQESVNSLASVGQISLLTPMKVIPVQAPISHLDSGGITIFGSTTTDIYQYHATSPFNIALIPYGWVSTFTSNGTWGPVVNMSLAMEIPEAIIWNPNNGHINVATTLNNLYEVSGSAIISQTPLIDYTGTVSTEPMGISDLKWFVDGHLYASTSMNDALLRIA